MGCFFGCFENPNNKKKLENPNHNAKEITHFNSNHKNKAQDQTSSTAGIHSFIYFFYSPFLDLKKNISFSILFFWVFH